MRYNDLNTYLKNKFGKKVYKLALNGGMTCPNRDGTLGTKGCIFCSAGGSGEFTPDIDLPIDRQIVLAKERLARKIKGDILYIAYFQAFTNTYAPVETLEKIFYQVIRRDDIAALSIATRPDCLPPDVINLLDNLNKIKPVWIELGLQSIHKKTAEYIRRGYNLDCFEKAMENLKAINIEVIVHCILGLPYETEDDMIKTARYVGASGALGIKLQLLHVLEGTDLASEYKKGAFKVLSLDEYVDIVIKCLEVIPPEMVIHRLTGDGPKSILIAPKWSADKRPVLQAIEKRLELSDTCQGAALCR